MERARYAEAFPGAGRRERSAPAVDLRWFDLKQFPYSLLIANSGADQLVVAVAHQKRRPGYWSERLDEL